MSKLTESGLHGALVADSTFSIDHLYNCLGVEEESRHQNMKRILEDEIKLLKKTKRFFKFFFDFIFALHPIKRINLNFYFHFKSNMKNESAFTRPLNSFKSDKQRIFTFRVGFFVKEFCV